MAIQSNNSWQNLFASGGLTPVGPQATGPTNFAPPVSQSTILNSPGLQPLNYNQEQVLGAKAPPVQTPTSGGGGGTTNTSSNTSSEPDLNAQLDAIFNPVFSSLQGQESTLRQNYAPVEGQIQAQGNLAQESLTNQQQSGMRELAGQEQAAGTRKEDALTSATRLYNELQKGGQQRFGGASSAGEAYQTLTATEQQRRQGTIQTAFETAMQQIGQYKANLQDKYTTAVKEVQLQTQQAIQDAQSQFRDALQQISAARNQAASDKATASMNLLQDLRNKVYAINQQSLQFAQQLALNNQATLKQVDAYTQNALQQVQGGQTTLNASPLTGYNPTTSYGVSGNQSVANTTPTGQTTKKYNPETGQWE